MRTHRFEIWPLAAMTFCAAASVALAGQGDDPEEAGDRRGGPGGLEDDDPLSTEDRATVNGGVIELADPRGAVDTNGSRYTESLDLTIVNEGSVAVHDVEFTVHLNNTPSDDRGWDPKHPDRFDHEMWIETTGVTVKDGERRPYHVSRSIRMSWTTFDIWMVGYRYDGKDALEALRHFHRGHAAMEAALRTFGLSFRASAEANAAALADVKEHAEDVRPTLVKWLSLERSLDSPMGYLKHMFAVHALVAIGEPEDLAAIVAAAGEVAVEDFDTLIERIVGPANEERWSTLEPYPAAALFGTLNTDETELDAPGYHAALTQALESAGDAIAPGLVTALDRLPDPGRDDGSSLLHGLGFAGAVDVAAALDEKAVAKLVKGEGGRFSALVLLSLAASKAEGAEEALGALRGEGLVGLVDGLGHPDPAAASIAEKALVKMGAAAREALLDARLHAGGAKIGAPEGDALVSDVKKLLEESRDADYREALAEVRDGGGHRDGGGGRAKKDAGETARRARAAAALRALGLKMPAKASESSGDDDLKAIAAALVEGGLAGIARGAIGSGERMMRLAARVDPKSGALDELRDALLARAEKMIGDRPTRAELDRVFAVIERADPDLESEEARDLEIEALIRASEAATGDEAEALLEEALEIDPDSQRAKDALEGRRTGFLIGMLLLGGVASIPLALVGLILLLRATRHRAEQPALAMVLAVFLVVTGPLGGLITPTFWFGVFMIVRLVRFRKFVKLSGGPGAVKTYPGPGLSRFASSEYGLFGQKWSATGMMRWEDVGYVYRRQQSGSPGQISSWLDVIAGVQRVSIPLDPGRVPGGQELIDLVHVKCPAAVARSQGGGGVSYRPAVHGAGLGGLYQGMPGGMPGTGAAPRPGGMPVSGSASGMPGAVAAPRPSGMPVSRSPAGMPGAATAPRPSGMPVSGTPVVSSPATAMPSVGAPLPGASSGTPAAPSGMPGAPSGMPGVRPHGSGSGTGGSSS